MAGRSIKEIRVSENVKKILANRKKMLGDAEYDIEISLTRGRMILSAASTNTDETIVVDIPMDKSIFYEIRHFTIANQIMEVFHDDYDLLIDKLQILDNKLMIIAPSQEELQRKKSNILNKSERLATPNEGENDNGGVKFNKTNLDEQ